MYTLYPCNKNRAEPTIDIVVQKQKGNEWKRGAAAGKQRKFPSDVFALFFLSFERIAGKNFPFLAITFRRGGYRALWRCGIFYNRMEKKKKKSDGH